MIVIFASRVGKVFSLKRWIMACWSDEFQKSEVLKKKSPKMVYGSKLRMRELPPDIRNQNVQKHAVAHNVTTNAA